MRVVIKTDKAPRVVAPYSQAIVAQGKFVFTAGQLGMDPNTGELLTGGVEEQTTQALNNIESVLIAAGSDMANVVKVTVFLKDMNDFAAMNGVYETFFTSDPPARTAVQAARLPKDALVEVEAIAVIP